MIEISEIAAHIIVESLYIGILKEETINELLDRVTEPEALEHIKKFLLSVRNAYPSLAPYNKLFEAVQR